MPFTNGRFYMNPAYGRALERAREADSQREGTSNPHKPQEQGQGAHWVTIDGRHVFIRETQAGRAQHHTTARHLSARDRAYLDKYYAAVAALAREYDVDPALVLGVGAESGFASRGTYLRTGDAFGMTGGTTKHMSRAASPSENTKQFFDNYGNQIRGTGSDASAFINALQGRNSTGQRVPGWKVYNSDRSAAWEKMTRDGIHQMQRDIPIYVAHGTK